MAGEAQFTIGARASCTDGHCGEVRRLIIDPATETVTHLVIQPGHRQQAGRLVPVHLVETTDGEIRLRCTRAEFDKLDHAAERDLVAGPELSQTFAGPESLQMVGRMGRMSAGASRWDPGRGSTPSMVRSVGCRASSSTRAMTG